MPEAKDPTQALKKTAAALPNVVEGTSCNQTSYKAGTKAFLYVGRGAKGIGYKAMFKLEESYAEATKSRGAKKKNTPRENRTTHDSHRKR